MKTTAMCKEIDAHMISFVLAKAEKLRGVSDEASGFQINVARLEFIHSVMDEANRLRNSIKMRENMYVNYIELKRKMHFEVNKEAKEKLLKQIESIGDEYNF